VDDNAQQPPAKNKGGRPKGSRNKAKASTPTSAPVVLASVVRMGRPPKLNKQVQDAFCLHLRRGMYFESAAALLGIDKGTLYDWLKKGAQDPSGPYGEFHHAVEHAQAEAERHLVGLVFDAGQKDWKAALSILERKFPQQWGRRQHISVEPVSKADARTAPFAFRVVGDDVEVQALPEPQEVDPQDPEPEAA
jgi:transposase